MAFQHEATLYAGEDEFVEATLPFIAEGLAAGEPVLVAVGGPKIERLGRALGADADRVRFSDIQQFGANPARIIPAWRDFVDERPPGTPVRGIGEPVWPERTAAEIVECHRHEALLNVAFADETDFHLLCPYDTVGLAGRTVEDAWCTHPAVVREGRREPSVGWAGLGRVVAPFADPLPAPPAHAAEMGFGADDFRAVRRLITGFSRRSGMGVDRTEDLGLAVHELAVNSVRHGGGRGVLRVWLEGDVVLCDVSDGGQLGAPLLGRVRPQPGQPDGYGLWLANQLCDLLQMRCFGEGSTVRAHMRVA